MSLYRTPPAFEATITIDLSKRSTPIEAGYRPDIKLIGDAVLYPIYPDFLDEHGDSIRGGEQILDLPARAAMCPLSEEVRAAIRGRIHVGQEIALHEGSLRIGTAVVTALRDL